MENTYFDTSASKYTLCFKILYSIQIHENQILTLNLHLGVKTGFCAYLDQSSTHPVKYPVKGKLSQP